MVHIGNDWDEILKEDFNSESYLSLRQFLIEEYKKYTVYPDMHDLFNALKYTSYKDTKVVILGQDPYYNRGQAHGYSFSVQPNVSVPPSLANVFKELTEEMNMRRPPSNGCLEKWASEGVLMLNSILTVRAGTPNSHKGIGWEEFTSEVINYIDTHCTVVFLAWGRQAQEICAKVTRNKVIATGHPSPRNTANPFVGSGCFRKANDELMMRRILPVRWNVLWIK